MFCRLFFSHFNKEVMMSNDENRKEKDRTKTPGSSEVQKQPIPKQRVKKIPDKPVKKPKIIIINEEIKAPDKKEEY